MSSWFMCIASLSPNTTFTMKLSLIVWWLMVPDFSITFPYSTVLSTAKHTFCLFALLLLLLYQSVHAMRTGLLFVCLFVSFTAVYSVLTIVSSTWYVLNKYSCVWWTCWLVHPVPGLVLTLSATICLDHHFSSPCLLLFMLYLCSHTDIYLIEKTEILLMATFRIQHC